MRVLGIDTSTHLGVVGLLENEKPRGEVRFGIRPGGAEKMPRVLHVLLKDLGWTPAMLDLIVIGTGPGSYTGMRVGLAFARSLAFALKRPLVSVPTHETVAENGAYSDGSVAVLADARRGEVYAMVGQFQPEKSIRLAPDILSVEDVCTYLNHEGQSVLLLGDGARIYREQFLSGLEVPVRWGLPEDDVPSGIRLARLGWERWQIHQKDEAETCQPLYLRRVEAEVRLDERRNGRA